MSGRHLRIRTLVLLAGLVLPLSACGSDDAPTAVMGAPANSVEAAPDPLAGAPVLDRCYQLTYGEAHAATSDKPPVPCTSRHTTRTFHIGRFPDDAVVADEAQVQRTCQRRLPKALGLSRAQLGSTVFGFVWFEPTTAQWAAGARWFRCDVVAHNADRYAALPQAAPPYDGVPGGYVRCIAPRVSAGEPVPCKRPHLYRWAGSFQGKGRTLPKEAALLRQAEAACPRFTGAGQFWVTWPSEEDWAAGDHTMDCYRQD